MITHRDRGNDRHREGHLGYELRLREQEPKDHIRFSTDTFEPAESRGGIKSYKAPSTDIEH